ncbi:esterase [Pectobacterium araliae]|uniref:Alpha/beta hydrolase n=2 Tax=Pectobacterium araliae TaxID=3073862 RepID=A0AAN0KBN4_9GAMM|nr:alpha/beta hydrolase [Pectobacterium sp. MAFF 302110]GKW20423.1 esterase [Pectobacterium carotovorum subsp. carotovorum]
MTPPEKVREHLAAWAQSATGLVEALQGKEAVDWNEARSTYDRAMAELFPAPEGISIAETLLNDIPACSITPDEIKENRTLFYIHGGGYASGSPKGYLGLAGRLALLLRAKAYIPDYRLAPQHCFPIPIDDVVRAYRAVIDLGHDPRSIIIAGDSAGGAMVVTLMRKLRDGGLPLPAVGFAMSPWANLTHTGRSMRTREHLDPACTPEFLTLLAQNFLGNALPTDPDASPVYADVCGLPPVLIHIGENELMLSDAIRLAAHLGENRVRVSLEVWPGMFHVWHLFAGVLPEADEALGNAVSWLEGVLSRVNA